MTTPPKTALDKIEGRYKYWQQDTPGAAETVKEWFATVRAAISAAQPVGDDADSKGCAEICGETDTRGNPLCCKAAFHPQRPAPDGVFFNAMRCSMPAVDIVEIKSYSDECREQRNLLAIDAWYRKYKATLETLIRTAESAGQGYGEGWQCEIHKGGGWSGSGDGCPLCVRDKESAGAGVEVVTVETLHSILFFDTAKGTVAHKRQCAAIETLEARYPNGIRIVADEGAGHG